MKNLSFKIIDFSNKYKKDIVFYFVNAKCLVD